jgi:cell wall-associated NlpC family hydrolase
MRRPTLRRCRTVLATALALAGAGVQAADPGEGYGDDSLLRLLQQRGVEAAGPRPANATPLQRARAAASELVVAALNFLDAPYQRGGNGGPGGEGGFDCSGFTRHVFGLAAGVSLPRRVDDQAGASGLSAVRREELEPGDLVFFNTLRRTFSHVGIYIGDHKFIHAPRSGAQVRVEDMRSGYWRTRFTGARRADALALADAAPR